MHRKQGTFSYRKNSLQTKDLGNNLRIKTEKMTNDVARIYFIDNQGNPTPLPANVVCKCSSIGEIIQSAVINDA
ncbi:189_t:CDS:1, partial [Funneliformis caledonium]